MIEEDKTIESEVPAGPLLTDVSVQSTVGSGTIVSDAHETTDSINVVLKIGAVVDGSKRKILEEAWSFIEAPGEKNWEDLVKHREAYGTVIAGCTDRTEWPWMHIISKRLLEAEHHIRIVTARNELEKPHPNLVTLLFCMKLATDSPVPFSDSIRHELTELNAEIRRKGLDMDIQNRMSVLSSTVGELIPYVSPTYAVQLRLIMEALEKNASLYVDRAKQLVAKTRGFALKQTDEKRNELLLIADRLEGLVRELQGAE